MSIPVITVKNMIDITKLQVQRKDKRTLIFLGKGGIGKSQCMLDLAKKMGIGFIDIRLLLYTEADMKGIPYPDEKHEKTIWLQNDILPRVDRDGERGILMFDEVTSAMRSVRTSVYQLINERRLGDYVLPDGWHIVCAGNGEEDGGDFQGMEGNFANRSAIFKVKSDLGSFKAYGIDRGLDPRVLAYVAWDTPSLHSYNPDDGSEDGLAFTSPRSWEAVSRIMKQVGNGEPSTLDKLLIQGNIGTQYGLKFISFCKFQDKCVDVQDIMNGEEISYPVEDEAMQITVQGLAREVVEFVRLEVGEQVEIEESTVQKVANSIKWVLGSDRLEDKVMFIKDIACADPLVCRVLEDERFDDMCPELSILGNEQEAALS